MAGFRSLARQVRDPRLLGAQQRSSLRRCLEHFAPYGHRATWRHLCEHHGFHPDDRHPPQSRLVAALEELEEARTVWLGYEAEFAARRKREKYQGVRRPTTLDDWHRRTWGGFGVAWCDDPAVHPAGRLAEVLRRLVTALDGEPGDVCPVCGGGRVVWREGLHHDPAAGPVCLGCGIVVPVPALSERALAAAREARYALR
ncbi:MULTISPECIES: hypothetical protein [Streptomycetaceae]|uniref:Uncharacterized protein n=1 Tax=Streptantibioticus cattleyicolor (strain ATCC 35852 / DSM 46488 / JCM 4925 / NBRC 14057 / NRRL 8057) TaxID=1003195 RepID=F8JX11_STREN|nr:MULTISPECIES: hypothetical protein [Streptomycetaceae]AEW93280.1 hypothetical protein SCATT_09090 [Streptantibioticus cattleyicolor NRRL 8057 = DSM 46488]MYS58000.1 hypothetical protein [Streptomyces sp. SID5468]CCB73641.1 conserved protein of unknown function [Streptantibioticus cattleyicolor NRRL 8057 = DSM 46488]